jgi:hydroxymethylbilane synthase
MPDRVVRVGTRSSELAIWQTNHVIGRLEAALPGLAFERVPIRTLGDRVKDVPLPRVGDRGLFTREIESGLRAGTIDVAVHSLKDLPTDTPDDLVVSAVLEREDARDVLVTARRLTLDSLPPRSRVGTSSIRRRAQVLARRPDLDLLDIRGNVPTRLDKVARGEYDATLLALAGLKRLGLSTAVSQVFELTELLPAPAQGALAVQVRRDDGHVRALTEHLDHTPTRLATEAERALLNALEGGCQAPLGTSATWTGDGRLQLHALVASYDGTMIVRTTVAATVATQHDAWALAGRAAVDLRERGADDLLRDCRRALAVAPRAAGEMA